MRRFVVLAAVIAVLTGCQHPVAGTPAPQPQKLDCDLIFPGPGAR